MQVDLTDDLKELAAPAAGDEALDELLRRGLDWLARVAPYDLATIFVLQEGRLVARAARGKLADERVKRHRLELANFPSLREAMETRRARAFTEHDHSHGDGDPFDGVLDLPDGHSCMVVPLYAGERTLGVLTLDRAVCEPYPKTAVELVEVYGQVLSAAIRSAEKSRSMERLHRQDHDHAKLLEQTLAGESAGILEASKSPAMRELQLRARQVALTDTPVLILGETGTGKERLARTLHGWSRRADQPFVAINCAAIPEGLIESELFGHVKGAFTGAAAGRPGRFQMANGGTLFLDEIGDLPPALQPKLLRVLQEGQFEPVGSDATVKVDVRILAATHIDIEKAIADQRFREDLYYRLSVFPLRLPPLRERLADLPRLAEVLLLEQARRTGRRGVKVTAEGLAKLHSHAWPGNLRELANVLERATILASGQRLGPDVLDLPAPRRELPAAADKRPAAPLRTLDDVQREHIERVLRATGGRVYGKDGAARLLGVPPSTLQSRMQRLGIRRAKTRRS